MRTLSTLMREHTQMPAYRASYRAAGSDDFLLDVRGEEALRTLVVLAILRQMGREELKRRGSELIKQNCTGRGVL